MSLTESVNVQMGTPAPDFNLPCIDGRNYSLANFHASKALVVIFMCNHCPYVRAIWHRLVKLEKAYRDKGVKFIGINSNDVKTYPEDSFDNMRKYAKEQGQEFPYLQDKTQEVAKAYNATCTPDIFVYDSKHLLAYHGRFDNSAGLAKGGEPTSQDLQASIDSLLSGQKPTQSQAPSMGCNIKWLK